MIAWFSDGVDIGAGSATPGGAADVAGAVVDGVIADGGVSVGAPLGAVLVCGGIGATVADALVEPSLGFVICRNAVCTNCQREGRSPGFGALLAVGFLTESGLAVVVANAEGASPGRMGLLANG